ncbi:MAG: general secretion pathway protein GspF [Candidatus Sedimenticola endophacoides]|uniref:General secretion pathway protein GspF n=1 Tax=Candidatus Sedimenticola endophacoides TaxID=2548426 RepID=A0A657Q346_9GAMM|nr:MAG: general secretion pathway protein GspF [Candidatus Sedimenticola endophacoides]OQX32537.1 MAG: general secretion pathway protein GspF [Candidatus Sedimenticola endophacoides]OQX38292.1 MAG: general secretion pathway protein GspF [Candidatus Sedimenticola endophacoides]OQX41010.1 MAG: general secretion pathway protein GspF [Candidatus Sedimenticola endophacoides]OQX44081.1 MAG: general secretion pathway protein GspF [Candidatus Sedimenticola endophacoides]
MALQRARTAQEYAEWVQQAKFEVDELKECLLYEMEELGRFPAFLEPLEEGVNAVYQAMLNGEYAFGREDFPFLEIANRHSDQIPFFTLLKQINETHRRGLDVGEDE